MEKFVLKNRKKIYGFIGVILTLAVVASFSPVVIANEPVVGSGPTGQDVGITSEVTAWLSFQVGATIDLGQLVEADGSTNRQTGQVDINIGTNNTGGWNVKINGLEAGSATTTGPGTTTGEGYGLFGSGADFRIPTLIERNAIENGASLYGATVEVGSGVDFEVESTVTVPYVDGGASEENHAGPVGASSNLFSYDSNHEVGLVGRLKVHASAAQDTPADSYEDTITLTAAVGAF